MGVLAPIEVEFVEEAAKYLENPSFIVRLADIMGMPVEGVLNLAPQRVADAVNVALRRTTDVAIFTLPKDPIETRRFASLAHRSWWTGYRHVAATALTGGVGGLCGTLGLCVELPVTTCVMLRSIGAIARVYGEDLREMETRLECLSLFGMGGPSSADDEMDASYLAVRGSLNTLVKHAAKFVAHTPAQEVLTSLKNGTAPTLVKLIAKISQRFHLVVSEKLMAQAIPVVGAVGGATVNVLFAEHFNAIARYHFGLRHLERRWGEEPIQAIYQEAAARHRPQKSWIDATTPSYAYREGEVPALPSSKPR